MDNEKQATTIVRFREEHQSFFDFFATKVNVGEDEYYMFPTIYKKWKNCFYEPISVEDFKKILAENKIDLTEQILADQWK